MANTIVDGGGKVMPASTVIKSNTTYINWVIQNAIQLLSNGLSVTGVKILHCTFQNNTVPPIFISTWANAWASGAAARSADIEIGYCTLTGPQSQQYYWRLQNVDGLWVHDIKILNTTGTADGGTIYCENSWGDIANVYGNNFYGKLIRFWPKGLSTSNLYNILATNSIAYSGIEIQNFAGLSDNPTVNVNNCTLGGFPENGAAGKIPTGGITLYEPNPPTLKLFFGDKKPNIVYDTTNGLLDDQGSIMQPGSKDVPQNTNWATVNKYFPTLAAAFPSGVPTLPDGTAWNAATNLVPPTGVTPTPPVTPIPPVTPPVTPVKTITKVIQNITYTDGSTATQTIQ